MEDGRGCRGVAAVEDGEAVAGGYWEREARALGLVVVADDGLTIRELVAVRGCDPVLVVPDWWEPTRREDACCWALCELHRRARGVEDARCQIRRAVAALAEAC